MSKQNSLFSTSNDKNRIPLGNNIFIETKSTYPRSAYLYRQNILIKQVVLSDKIAKRIFVVEAVELGAKKSRLALALEMSRQTIDNLLGIKQHFGLEGLAQGYSPSTSKSRRKQREIHLAKNKGIPGNKAKQLAEIRREAKEKRGREQQSFNFRLGFDTKAEAVADEDQPYAEEHDWIPTRYAGVFVYLITLIKKWGWLKLVKGHYGFAYKIFMIFVLMSARNIRSIEQLKNVRLREGGILLGIKRIPSKPIVWQWFYRAAEKQISTVLKRDFFRYQICNGIVGIWLWFIDGHLLPYTGKAKVHHSYNTQRRMPYPGQTNMVTCDCNGRIIDFEIEEGKGDLRKHIVSLWEKWIDDLPESPVMVFDREGSGVSFFSELVLKGILFVTWEKNVDSKALSAIDEKKFTVNFKFNDKEYSIFEDKKGFTYEPENPDEEQHNFTLRHIYIWNKSSNRRTCGLAWTGDKEMSTQECAHAILNRWGASENTFKHTQERHPLHYHPGFKLNKSEKQDIKNPLVTEMEGLIKRVKNRLAKLYKGLSKTKDGLRKDGTSRENSLKERLKKQIHKEETDLSHMQEEKKNLSERVDVTSLENYSSFKCIDNEGKNLFDFVTASIWNARKQMVDWLRNDYKHENDLVDLFYAITNCHGWIKSTKNEVIVRLEPIQQKSRRLAQEQLCRKLTSLGAIISNGKCLRIETGTSPL
jgi:hypothetical protein